MFALLQPQLEALATCTSSNEMRALYGRLVRDDWFFLRGDFARVYVQADRGYHRLLHLAVNAEAQPIDQGEDVDDDERPAP